ncbi:hypothetical protein [Methylocystis sp.]|uniref:hypothetical protein n=1 Tax=Methylocystis sp. TaxID=1911079 RepID=UPI003D0D47D5
MSKSIKMAVATGGLLIGLMAQSGVARAQPWDGWRGFGWGGGASPGFGWGGGGQRGAILPGVHWAGRWGGRAGPGRPAGWGQPWGWSYYRTDLPAYSGSGWGGGSPYYGAAGYDGCYQLRRAWTRWGWRRIWANVCWSGWGWGGGTW